MVIIDMQPEFVTRGGNDKTRVNVEKVDAILKAQVEAIKIAKEKGIPIIFIEYEKFGNTNDMLKKAAEGYTNATYFLKNSDGMFSGWNSHKKELVDFLEKKEIGTLLVTGANGGACVLESIQGALSANYNVVAYTKGIADFNYPDFIYPYEHHYDTIKPSYESCTLLEVDNVSALFATATASAGADSKDLGSCSVSDSVKIQPQAEDMSKILEALEK